MLLQSSLVVCVCCKESEMEEDGTDTEAVEFGTCTLLTLAVFALLLLLLLLNGAERAMWIVLGVPGSSSYTAVLLSVGGVASCIGTCTWPCSSSSTSSCWLYDGGGGGILLLILLLLMMLLSFTDGYEQLSGRLVQWIQWIQWIHWCVLIVLNEVCGRY